MNMRAATTTSTTPIPTRRLDEHRPYRVLLVEDQEEDAASLRRALYSASYMRFDVTVVEWLSEGVHLLQSANFDVALVDLFLPDSSGIETVARLCEVAPSTPIIALARLNTESVAIEALRAGAADYYVKGEVDAGSLVRVVRYAIERKRSEERLRLLSEAGALLSTSLDYESTLRRIAELVVPAWADRCVIDLVREAGGIRRVEIGPPSDAAPGGIPTIQSQSIDNADFEQFLKQMVQDHRPPGDLEGTSEVADAEPLAPNPGAESEQDTLPRLMLVVPLFVRGQVIGTMTFHAPEAHKAYNEADAVMLNELAQRCALALDNAYLYQKMERSLYARERFVASVSHDLRTPLTAAVAGLGLVELSVVDRLLPDEMHLIGNVRRNVERLAILIDDLITFGEVESQTLYLQLKPVDLCTIIERSLAAVEPLLDDKRQTLEVDLPGPMPYNGDRKRLDHMVINLLENAHRHTPKGTHIVVRGGSTHDEYRITISDNGPGIPEANRETIFERFHSGEARQNGGWGLGLALARSVAAMHHGRIWAESKEGKGATFHVALPKEMEIGR